MESDGSKSSDLPDVNPPAPDGAGGSAHEISVPPTSASPADVVSSNSVAPDATPGTANPVGAASVDAISTPAEPAPDPRWRHLPWLVVIFAILLTGYVRFRLRDFPLERDEGEYAYAGQLILQGIPPYQLAYNMKLPGTYLAYAMVMAVFGQTTAGIHLGLIVVSAASIVLVFLLGRKLFDPAVGAVAAACYAVMSLSPALLGMAAHATHFVVLPMLAAMLCLLRGIERGRHSDYFWSGLLFGVAFLMKQQGVFFGVFGGLWIMWVEFRHRQADWGRMGERVGFFSMGAVLPFVLACFVLWLAGVFEMFWFWTFDYAREYVACVPLAAARVLFLGQLEAMESLHWSLAIFAGVGVVLLWFCCGGGGRCRAGTPF